MKKSRWGALSMIVLFAAACDVADATSDTASESSDLKVKHCGGFVAHPKSCASGYTCVVDPHHPDLPGTCKKETCVQKVFCVQGSHFDTKACACVSDCAENVGCGPNEHFDTTTCACVATCVDTVLCVQGKHWDSTACACVPN